MQINTYIENLNDIIQLIKSKKIKGEDEALEKFNSYLDTVNTLGKFSIENWPLKWRENVWEFGELFSENDPIDFLNILDGKLNLINQENREVLEFIRSEIIASFMPEKECKNQLQKLIGIYPYNPEFRHTLGHYYKNEKNYLLAIEQYKLALKIEPSNRIYLEHRFEAEYSYLNERIKKGEYPLGKDYVNSVFEENFYKPRNTIYHNIFTDFVLRFEDHILFQQKLFSLEDNFKEKMKSELESERKRIIEILGFFSAIMAFILSTVSIGEKFNFLEAIYFLIGLGLILILFSITMSMLFTTSKQRLFADKKFWILIFGLFLLFLMIITTGSIATIVNKIS